jgi:hypothetical protein|tara:strand:+ start:43 stop:621 length:579 start_codon:yes stop_codon:yes gene_type:complete
MRLKLKNTEKYLKAYTKELLKLTIKELDRDDRVRNYNTQTITSRITASGSLKESLNISEKSSDSILQLNIKGNSYAEDIDEGTTSTAVSKGKIIQWINNKNGFKDLSGNVLDLNNIKKVERIAGLISKSLNFNGIKATNFLTDIVNSRIKELKNIEAPIGLDIESDIDNVLLKLGYKKKDKDTYTIETKTIQ